MYKFIILISFLFVSCVKNTSNGNSVISVVKCHNEYNNNDFVVFNSRFDSLYVIGQPDSINLKKINEKSYLFVIKNMKTLDSKCFYTDVGNIYQKIEFSYFKNSTLNKSVFLEQIITSRDTILGGLLGNLNRKLILKVQEEEKNYDIDTIQGPIMSSVSSTPSIPLILWIDNNRFLYSSCVALDDKIFKMNFYLYNTKNNSNIRVYGDLTYQNVNFHTYLFSFENIVLLKPFKTEIKRGN